MSHYPHSGAYYYACDKYGVLVLECMSGWQNFNNSDAFKESTYTELRTMIRNSRNHPCIAAWETSLNEPTVYKFILQGSNDSTDWTDIADFSDNTEVNGRTTITVNAAYRYFRVYDIEASGGMWPAIAEFEIYTETGELSDKAREKPAYSSSSADGCTAENGNSGEPGTFWYPDAGDDNIWWYADTGAVYDFERIEIGRNELEEHRFIISLSDDGENWTIALDRSDNNVKEIQTVEKISASGRYVRISFIGDNQYGFNMFCAYGK